MAIQKIDAYQEEAMRTANHQHDAVDLRLSGNVLEWIDGVTIDAIEAANRMDMLKKHVFYGRELGNMRLPSGVYGNIYTCNQHLLHAAMGLVTEAAEVLQELRKSHSVNGHPPKEKILEEAGDVLWYLALLAESLGVDLSEIATGNIQKLRERYGDGYSDEKALHRDERHGQ